MQNYLVTMLDRLTGEECRVIVQSDCPHGMQPYVDQLAREGKLDISCPVVIDIDDRSVRHIPIVDPVQ